MPKRNASTQTILKRTAKRRYQSARASRVYNRPVYGVRGDGKYHDVAVSGYGNDTTGSITHLDVVPQGNTVTSREGKAFAVKSVWIRGRIENNVDATTNQYANYLVWDYQPNKALPAITDILDSVNSVAFPKRENQHRFKIVKTIAGALSGDQDSQHAGNDRIRHIDEYVRLPASCIALTTGADTTGVIGNRVQGALLWVTVGNVGNSTANAFTTCTFRINIVDI